MWYVVSRYLAFSDFSVETRDRGAGWRLAGLPPVAAATAHTLPHCSTYDRSRPATAYRALYYGM